MKAAANALFALFALTARMVVATPPACLIAGVNTQPDPSNLQAVCKNSTQVQEYLFKNCGPQMGTAMSGFASVCSGAGVPISISSASSSASTTGSASETGSATSTERAALTTDTLSAQTIGGTAGTSAVPYTTNGTVVVTPTAASGASASSSGTGDANAATVSSSSPSSSSSGSPASGQAARLGMDIAGMAALGMFGCMLAM